MCINNRSDKSGFKFLLSTYSLSTSKHTMLLGLSFLIYELGIIIVTIHRLSGDEM